MKDNIICNGKIVKKVNYGSKKVYGGRIMRRFILIFLMLSSTIMIFGQLQWQEGGIAVNYDYPLYWYPESGEVLNGVSYYVWTETESGNPDLYMQGYGVDGEAVWSENLLLCGAAKYQGRSQVISSSDGNLIVGWHDTRNLPGLWFGEEYELYIQKISPSGEILWDQGGILTGNCYPYDYQLISDDQGGCYLEFRSVIAEEANHSFWHYNSEGNVCPGWENGIIYETGYYFSLIKSDGWGNLVILSASDAGTTIKKVSAEGELLWDNIYISTAYAFHSAINSRDMNIDIFYEYESDIFQQSINYQGALQWNQPILICSSGNYISEFLVSKAENGYYVNYYEYNEMNKLLKVDYNANIEWINETAISNSFNGMHSMNNGNVRLWTQSSNTHTLYEYNGNGDLVSPANGWWTYQNPTDYWNYQMGVFSDGEISSFGWREMTDDRENEVFMHQSIDSDGEIIYAEAGTEIKRGRNSGQLCEGVYKINDLEIVLLQSWYMSDQRMIMKLFDEDGNIVGDDEGMPISCEGADDAKPLGVYGERLYFVMEVSDQSGAGYTLLYLNAVDFSGEPELVWGDSGRLLGEGEFINTNINMTTIPGENNTLLFSWNVDSPYGYSKVQKLFEDDFIWEEGGKLYQEELSNTHRITAYYDYLFRVLSWGNGFYLGRLDADGNLLWDNELPIVSSAIHWNPIAIPQENGNLLFLYGEYTANGLQLVEHRITPEGEDLSGTSGDVLVFFNGYNDMKIIDQDGSYAVVLWNDQEIALRRFEYSGDEIGEAVVMPETEYCQIMDVEILNEHLVIYEETLWGGEQLAVYDFAGLESDLLPENPYQYLEYSNYYNSILSCTDDNDLYFCWLEGGSSERPDEGEYGFNWKMQKFRIPQVETTKDAIPVTIKTEIYPNPFNPELQIMWESTKPGRKEVDVSIYNAKGQQVKVWKHQELRGNLVWDGKDKQGSNCSTGIYFIKIRSGSEFISQKVVLIK